VPSARATTISFLSPRLRSNAMSLPERAHTGLASLRPDSIAVSGRTETGTMGVGVVGSSAAAAGATATSAAITTTRARTRRRRAAFMAL